MIKRTLYVFVIKMLFLASSGHAAVITLYDTNLASGGYSYSKNGVTLTVSAGNGGVLSKISTYPYIGLWIGGNTSSFGTYTFTSSIPLSAIEIQFEALTSGTGGQQSETIGGFAVSSGFLSINYTNIQDTTFNGFTVTPTDSDGRGIITTNSLPFNWFSFDHAQDPARAGFVIEKITMITTVPVPASVWLFGSGLLGLVGFARRKT